MLKNKIKFKKQFNYIKTILTNFLYCNDDSLLSTHKYVFIIDNY